MADQKLTDKAELLTPDGADWLHTVDVDDLASSPKGTSKKVSYTNAGAKIISDSDTDDLSEGSVNLYNRVPTGGATNNVLAKNSAADFDADFTGDPQVDSLGIGGAPDSTAILDAQSTTQSILVPRMTNTQKVAIPSPPDGSIVYDTSQKALNYRNNGIWDSRRVLDKQSIILPVHPGIGTADTGVSGDATLKGGIYRSFEAIRFNRVYVDVSTYSGTPPITMRFLIYQNQSGIGAQELVCTVEDFDPGATGVQIAIPLEDPVILIPGLDIVVLWGEDGAGNISLLCHTVSEISLYNSDTALAIGQVATTFDTTISSTTSPATVDPRVGGADGFVGAATADTMPILRFNFSVPFSIRQAIYSGLSFDLSNEDSAPWSVQFNADGTKMFSLGNDADIIFQYTLTTGFDVSTASYDTVSFSIASEVTNPRSFAFNPAGTKMFVIDSSSPTIYQYTLSSGFDMSTASYDTVSFSVSALDSSFSSITFNPAGTKMFVVGINTKEIFQHTLSSGYDLTTASYDSVSFSVASEDIDPHEALFNLAGTKMVMLGTDNAEVFQYTLSSGYDLTTASYDEISFSVASEDTFPLGLTYSTDGEKMYMIGVVSGFNVFQYALD